MQVLLLIAMPLAVAVVESFWTMLDAEELSPFSSTAQIMELESTAANTVKMLESDAQVAIIYMKISQVCCRLYCYECTARLTTPTAIKE